MDCFVRFHEECLTPEFGGSEDLSNPFCPYCWFKIVAAKSESLREKAIEAEKAVFKYLDKESVPKSQEDKGDKAAAYSSKEEQEEEGKGKLEMGTGKSRDMEEDDKVRAEVEVSKDEEMVDTENFQDAKSESLREKAIEEEKAVFKYLDKESVPKAQEDTTLSGDQELQGDKAAAACSSKEEQEEDKRKLEMGTGKSRDMQEAEVEVSKDEEMVETENFQDAEVNRTKGNTGAGKKGDLSPFLSMQESFPGKEEHGQVQQNEKRRRRRLVKLGDIDNETSSSKERIGEDVTELITSSPSVEMNNQQRKLVAAKSNTASDISFFNKDQRRRLLWTFKEEEMLKAGVEKFAAEANKNMPWRKILEMGENVFHQSRSPSDLKDKWRNMIKALH